MGDANQYMWVKNHAGLIRGPVLEIGSRHYDAKSSNDFRALCRNHEYTGIDMSAGENVDLVLDFTRDFATIDRRLDGRRFGTVLCMSVMEHVADIFSFARNLTDATAAGAHLFVSVPFSWRFHGYPSDYWRFSPEAIKFLFPGFEFQASAGIISTHIVGDVVPLPENLNEFAVVTKRRGPLGLKWLGGHRYVLKPTMIGMLGTRRA
jgi:hypothetical protein